LKNQNYSIVSSVPKDVYQNTMIRRYWFTVGFRRRYCFRVSRTMWKLANLQN